MKFKHILKFIPGPAPGVISFKKMFYDYKIMNKQENFLMIFDKAVESELQFCIYIIYCAETLPKRHDFMKSS